MEIEIESARYKKVKGTRFFLVIDNLSATSITNILSLHPGVKGSESAYLFSMPCA